MCRRTPRSVGAAVLVGLLQLAWLPTASATCLPGGIPPESQINLETLDGNGQVPFGLWAMNWDSAKTSAYVIKLLAAEVLGYNSTISGIGGSSASGLHAVAGCHSPNTFATDAQCTNKPMFIHHASVEVWGVSLVAKLRKLLEPIPEVMPEGAGDLGYPGIQGTYVYSREIETAYAQDGIALEYYRSYDAAWTSPQKYFDNYTAFDLADLRPCSETRLIDSAQIEIYLNLTGDHDGVVRNPDGTLSARCWNGSWWFAPACRNNPETCIPSITGSNGWFTEGFMQRSGFYNMPLAMAVAKSGALWRKLSRETKSAPFWWQPDSSFIELRPKMIQFPPFNPLEKRFGHKTTMEDSTPLSKWMHSQLGSQSSRLREFMRRVSISMDNINEMLLENKRRGGNFIEETVCWWARNNEQVWRSWIPVKTECVSGQGLIAEDGSFVERRADAAGCNWCPPGNISTRLTDNMGSTYVCLECQPGTSQPRPGQTECDACEPGTFAAAYGSRECARCTPGTYQSGSASSQCDPCGPHMTTRVTGSTNVSECICQDSFFAPKRPGATVCEPCPVGMDCQIGSTEANIPASMGAASGGEYPRPLPTYYTTYSEPLSVYRCLTEGFCPGGEPEACVSDSDGIACGRCMEGFFASNQGCEKCSDFAKSTVPAVVLVLLVGPLVACFLYKTSRDPLSKWGNPSNAISAAIFLTLVYVQIIGTVRTCYLIFPTSVSGTSDWTTYSLDLAALLRPECNNFEDFKLRFIMRLMMPIFALVIFVATWAFSRVVERSLPNLHMDGHVMFGVYGGVYNTFFIGIASQTFTLFQCYEHPNGRRSLRSAPDVLCDSQTWRDLLVVAVGAILIFCGGALALFTYINVTAPNHFHDEVFRKKWRFLFMRFRPSVWWWGTLLLLKGVWLNLTTVLFLDGHLQLAWLTWAHAAYMVAVYALLPWRSLGVAALDVGMHALLILIFSTLPHFALLEKDFEKDVASQTLICFGLPMLGALITLCSQLQQHFSPPPPEYWDEKAQKLCALMGKVSNTEELTAVLEVLPTADIWTLEAAKTIVQDELLKGDTDDRDSARQSGMRQSATRRLSMHHATSSSSLGGSRPSSNEFKRGSTTSTVSGEPSDAPSGGPPRLLEKKAPDDSAKKNEKEAADKKDIDDEVRSTASV